jgi:hypothetical protein
VWLAPGAPSSIVDRLGAAGLYVVGDDTIGRRQERYGDSGPAAALRFQLLGAALARLGADVERTVLARAVRWHCEDRLLQHQNTVLVF